MSGDIVAERQSILDGLADRWDSEEIRNLASSLMRLADAVDQDWDGSNLRSVFRWPNALARIERNAVNLAMKARIIYDQRMRRQKFVPAQVMGEPAWDMLLELFMQYAGGAKVSVTSLSLASHVPQSTALRYIAMLEDEGMISRSHSASDKRVVFIGLTEVGIKAVGLYLEQS